MNYDKAFYDKYGYKVNHDATMELEGQEYEDYVIGYEMLMMAAQTNRISAIQIRTLKRFVEKYPGTPAFKNHLYGAYTVNKDKGKAERLLMEMVNRHPDYLFGKISLISKFLDENNLDAARQLLGKSRELRDFFPDKDVFHISEFLNYQQVVAKYEIMAGDETAAKKCLEMMIDLAPEHVHTQRVAMKIRQERLKKFGARHKEAIKKSIKVVFKPSYILEQTENPPILTNEDLEGLYLYSDEELPKDIMKDIMELPRESLIADLEKILEDSIRRDDFFQKKHEEYFNNDEQSFPIHALRFLTILGDEKSLPVVLNMLRQSKDFLDYWFADWGLYFDEPLFLLGKNQLEALKSYVFEPHQHSFSRVYAAKVAAQVGLHYPARRDEAVQWYIEVFEYLLAHENDEGLIDSDFIGWMLCDAKDLRAPEMIPYLEQMDEKGWINYLIGGDVEQIKKDIASPMKPADIDPMPQDIYEVYTREHLNRRAKRDMQEFEKILDSEVESYIMSFALGGLARKLDNYKDDDEFVILDEEKGFFTEDENKRYSTFTEPVRRDAPKIGRNDPCSCGSGKKYKKCCLNK